MKAAAGLLFFALTGVQGKGGKGYGVPARTYGRPNSPSNAYKYAGAAGAGVLAGGAVGYYVGSRRYTPSYRGYGDYDDYDDYDDHYAQQYPEWDRQHTTNRPTNCAKPAVTWPQPEYTKAYVWAQVAIGIPRSDLKAIELETDLFRDLVWRSPCVVPTQVLISYVCGLDSKRKINRAEMDKPSVCTYSGSVESTLLGDSRRKLAQNGQQTVVELAVGVRNKADYANMVEAVKEALDEPYSEVRKTYQTAATVTGSSVLSTELSTEESASGARTLQALIMGTIFAVFSLL